MHELAFGIDICIDLPRPGPVESFLVTMVDCTTELQLEVPLLQFDQTFIITMPERNDQTITTQITVPTLEA